MVCGVTSLPVMPGVEDSPGLGDQVDWVAALVGEDLPGEERTGDKDCPDPPGHQLSSESSENYENHQGRICSPKYGPE